MGSLVAALSGAPSAWAQDALEETSVAIAATRDTQVGVQLAVADALGYFKDEGLDVQPTWVQSGGETIQLLGSGAVPVGSNTTFGAMLLKSQGIEVKIVQGLVDMSGAQGLVLAPGVELGSPAELEGKSLAYTEGNPQVLILAKLAEKYGFDVSKITLVNMQPSEGLVAAEKGDVAGLLGFEPFLYRLSALGGSRYVTGRQSWVDGSQAELGPDDQLLYLNGVLLVQDAWVKEKPNTVKALMRAFNRATEYVNANQKETIAILQQGIKLDESAIQTAMDLNSYSSVLGAGIERGVSNLSEWATKIGRIPAPITAADIVDTSLLEQVDPALVEWKP